MVKARFSPLIPLPTFTFPWPSHLQLAQRAAHQSAPALSKAAKDSDGTARTECVQIPPQWLQMVARVISSHQKKKQAVVLLFTYNFKNKNLQCINTLDGDLRFGLFWDGGQLSLENSSFPIVAAAPVQLLTEGSAAVPRSHVCFSPDIHTHFFQVPLL